MSAIAAVRSVFARTAQRLFPQPLLNLGHLALVRLAQRNAVLCGAAVSLKAVRKGTQRGEHNVRGTRCMSAVPTFRKTELLQLVGERVALDVELGRVGQDEREGGNGRLNVRLVPVGIGHKLGHLDVLRKPTRIISKTRGGVALLQLNGIKGVR